jgi:uncharacterized protein (TIGR03089 family)
VDLVPAPTVDLAARMSAASGRPLITYVDDATGERTDLDAAALASWVARTASLLRDACQLHAGDRVAILLPPHWQTAVVVLGAWSTGLALSFRPWSTAGLRPATNDALDAVFVARNRVDSWLEEVPPARHRFVLGLGSGAADLDEVPYGYRDFLAAVRRQPAVAPAYWTVPPTDAASTDGTTFQEWAGLARAVASSLGLRAGDRVPVDAANDGHPASWLLAPLSVGASIYIRGSRDQARTSERIRSEGIDHAVS